MKSVIDDWRRNLPLIAFSGDARTPLGLLIRSVAESNGFAWRSIDDESWFVSDGVVMVGTAKQLDWIDSERDRRIREKYRDREEDLYFGSSYRVELGKEEVLLTEPPDDYDMGESLLDWMLTEWFDFARGNFVFVSTGDECTESLSRFKSYLDELTRQLKKILIRERRKVIGEGF